MIAFTTIRWELVRGLSEALGVKVIEINSPIAAPKLPFVTYDFSVGMYQADGGPVKLTGTDAVTLTETAEFTVDFQFTAIGRGEAIELALRARDWFIGAGHDVLKYGPAATVIVHADQVDNRDVQIGDDWTYQYGFEVLFRAASSTSYAQTTIDKATIKEVDPIV